MSADSANKSWKDTPYLYDLEPDSWKEFERLYKAYKARGGTRDLVSLIDPDLHGLIKIQLDKDELFDSSDERSAKVLLEEINKLYAPCTLTQSMELLRDIKFGDEGSTRNRVVRLVHNFNVALKGMTTTVKPAPKILIKLLVNKVRPRSICELTFNDLELVEGANTNYDFTVRTLLDHAKEYDRSARVAPINKKDTDKNDKKKDNSGKKSPRDLSKITCYACGKKGHYKNSPECPKYDSSKDNNKIVEENNLFIEDGNESMPKINVNIGDIEIAAIMDSGSTRPSMSKSMFSKVKHLMLGSKDVDILLRTANGPVTINKLKTFKIDFKNSVGKVQQEVLDFTVSAGQYHDLLLPHWLNKKHNLYASDTFKKGVENKSHVNRATGLAPARILYGNAINWNRNLIKPVNQGSLSTYSKYFNDNTEKQRLFTEAAIKSQNTEVEKNLRSNPGSSPIYKVGEYVLVKYPTYPKGTTKFCPKWKGPMTIVERRNDQYTVQDLNDERRITTQHVTNLKPYTSHATTKYANTVGISGEDYPSKRVKIKKLMTISRSKENNSIT